MAKLWRKGMGKLGLFLTLIGSWIYQPTSPMGPVRCIRIFESVLGEKYLRLVVR